MDVLVLGSVVLRREGEVVGPSAGLTRALIGVLGVAGRRGLSDDALIESVWGDHDAGPHRQSAVKVAVHRTRSWLRQHADDQVRIERTSTGYALVLASGEVDCARFSRLVGEAEVLSGEERVRVLAQALDLWRGEPLADVDIRGVTDSAVAELFRVRRKATVSLGRALLESGRPGHAVDAVVQEAERYPLDEPLQGVLIEGLAASGSQAEALDRFERLRSRLADELGVDPGRELSATLVRVLRQELPGAEEDDGRLAARVAEVEAARHEAPQHMRPCQLPADTGDYTGNERLIAAAENVLVGTGRGRAVGVVIITGRAGVGKSTLATHIGHRVAEGHFPDGQLHCDMRRIRAGADGAVDVLGRFLLALGIPGPAIPDGLDLRVDLYRTLMASRRILVVLDDAGTESQVAPLLPGSRSCAVIITTRSRLTGLPGARQLELDVLQPAQSLELLGHVVGTERVEREPEAAIELVRAVSGLPLALRIIGARLAARPHWSLASMLQRLANERHRLDELAHGDMTVRASLSLTHDSLAPQARRLFGLLSVAEWPTLPCWSAGAVLDDDSRHPSDLFEPLVDVRLLDVAVVENTGGFRYRYHDLVRLFARERLAAEIDPAEQRSAFERMTGGWLAITEQAHRRVYGGDFTVLHGTAPRWCPPADYLNQLLADPLDWMEGEHANLCAAVMQTAEAGLDEACWDLAVTLVTLFEARGYLDDWERTHRAALAATRLAGNLRGTAALLGSLGTLHINRGQPGQSRSALVAALEIFKELGDPQGLALCHRDLALLDRQAGDDDSAFARYAVALREFDRVGDVVGRAIVLTQSAPILVRRGRIERANAMLAEAIGIYQAVGYSGGMPHTLRRVGQLQLMSGDFDAAATTMTQVLEMVRKSRDIIGEGYLLCSLGEVHAAAGRLPRAREYFQQALVLREQIMDNSGAATTRLELARTLVSLGETEQAASLLEQALATFGERGMDRERLIAERELASLGVQKI